MEQPEGYELKPGEVFEIDTMAGLQIVKSEEEGTEEQNTRSLVALVDKAIYGTMDAGRNWWRTLDKDMARLGYKRSRADQS
ncbi:hypothetical protein H0H87_000830, partial [Tephrocybe sp. NHM501043]